MKLLRVLERILRKLRSRTSWSNEQTRFDQIAQLTFSFTKQTSIVYANEADVLNMAMFGITAKQWRDANPDLKGNIRDYANINELICLSNMENLNSVFIN